jgi:Na+-transporting methylmalonyl-CoA/oxaloacetate decarboxylase gamma subunit
MDKWSFGLVMMVGGVAGTFLMLSVLVGAIALLKKVFPASPGEGEAR